MIVLEERRIVYCSGDDRTILILKQGDEVIGLNYCQGEVDINWFKANYGDIEEDLSFFYNAIAPYLGGETEVDRINQAIWAHFEYRNLKDQHQ